MAFSNWVMQAGDPTGFAFKLAFLRNPHGDDDRASIEERESWGSFSVWVQGENLCSHIEQGETLDSAHWYMISLIEWLVDNWDALLHEERLPLSNVGLSAAESLSLTKRPPISLKEVDEFEWLDVWSTWWGRHSFRASREGGLFPDLYLRRYRDSIEVSTGAESLPGIPEDHIFLTPNRVYRVDPPMVAESFYTVLNGAVKELRRRIPESSRLERLDLKVADLISVQRKTSRMAWLAGFGDDIEVYSEG
jgi:hypothetical protein